MAQTDLFQNQESNLEPGTLNLEPTQLPLRDRDLPPIIREVVSNAPTEPQAPQLRGLSGTPVRPGYPCAPELLL